MRAKRVGGGWPSIFYTLRKAREAGGVLRFWRALRARNACKTCALGMGGQLGGMVNERGRFPEVCKKSVQAMAADMQGAVHRNFFDDFNLEKLRGFSSKDFEAAGRLTRPMYAGPLDQNYRAVDWDEALAKIIAALRKIDPCESFWYFSGRSSNEAAFVMQLFARLYGTNNINNCSYFCHQASGVGLSTVTGSGAGTVTLEDVDHADLLFVIGANPACNHPRLMRTIVELRRRGGTVVVINPLRETGLVRFKVPSDWRSMIRASTIADHYIQPNVGGDCALLAGLAKSILERSNEDEAFMRAHTDDGDAFRASIEAMKWGEITRRSGVDRATIDRLADLYAGSKNTIFCWAMGITHHEHGVENVQMIANVALLRGMIGRPGAGLLPLRGHSNVQGVGSMGVVPQLKPHIAAKLTETFGITLPETPGHDTLGCLERAHDGGIRFASCLGGNLYGSSPDANYVAAAFAKIDTVVYFSTTLNTGHAWARGRETLILPVLARDEEPQATTQESMFSYVRLSDGGEARHDGPRSEVDLVLDLAEAYFGDDVPVPWSTLRDRRVIREKIAVVIPGYQPMNDIDRTKREFHIPGRRFAEPRFTTDTGRARFHAIELPPMVGNDDDDTLRMMTMRSEGQFNTVVYEDEDIYRGQERRDVILMHRGDIERLGLAADQRVTVRSSAGALSNVIVRPVDIAPGNAAMYYPEANVLVPRVADPRSRTPGFKSFAVRIETNGRSDNMIQRSQTSGAVQRGNLKAC